jgi:hypothetical protein
MRVHFKQQAKRDLKEDETLLVLFLNCAASFNFISIDRKKHVFKQLVEKVANAKINDEMKIYAERKNSPATKSYQSREWQTCSPTTAKTGASKTGAASSTTILSKA